MTQSEIFGIGATRFSVGLSQVLRFTPPAGYHLGYLKIISGGTLEFVNPQFFGTSTQAGSASLAWGCGYPLSSTEIYPIQGPATYYLAASSATVVVGVAMNYSAGCTLV